MSEMKNINEVIAEALSLMTQKKVIAEQEGVWDVQRDLESRCIFLENLMRDFGSRKSGSAPGKTVFVSYSVHSGRTYFELLRKSLEAADFEVITGFDRAPGDQGDILTRIMSQLSRSTVYLGLLTKEMRVKGSHAREQWSPSVWTMEEKGMALAMGKPVVLLVQEGIHSDYWQKTVPHKVHFKFTPDDFSKKSLDVVEAVKDRYTDLLGDRLRIGRRALHHYES